MNEAILTINSGSSTIKFSIFLYGKDNEIKLLYYGNIDRVLRSPCLTIFNMDHNQVLKQELVQIGHKASLNALFNWLENLSTLIILKAVGHRVVHGGKIYTKPILIKDKDLENISNLVSLAPLHQEHNLEAIKIIKSIYPNLLQVACFDTSFHHTQNKLAKTFAIPSYLTNEGIIRYGFHGISYEYIVSIINNYIGDKGKGRVIVAHLGNGASMCAMYRRKSVATSMGFSTLDGLMMGTRSGRIDPGVLLHLLRKKQFSLEELENLLYNESGLLGVAGGISNDMRELLESKDKKAKEAIDLFCYFAATEFGTLVAALKGCEVLIFTAGIGENSPIIRQKICNQLSWLGIKINSKANQANSTIISSKNSKIIVGVIPTNEELMLAKHTVKLIN